MSDEPNSDAEGREPESDGPPEKSPAQGDAPAKRDAPAEREHPGKPAGPAANPAPKRTARGAKPGPRTPAPTPAPGGRPNAGDSSGSGTPGDRPTPAEGASAEDASAEGTSDGEASDKGTPSSGASGSRASGSRESGSRASRSGDTSGDESASGEGGAVGGARPDGAVSDSGVPHGEASGAGEAPGKSRIPMTSSTPGKSRIPTTSSTPGKSRIPTTSSTPATSGPAEDEASDGAAEDDDAHSADPGTSPGTGTGGHGPRGRSGPPEGTTAAHPRPGAESSAAESDAAENKAPEGNTPENGAAGSAAPESGATRAIRTTSWGAAAAAAEAGGAATGGPAGGGDSATGGDTAAGTAAVGPASPAETAIMGQAAAGSGGPGAPGGSGGPDGPGAAQTPPAASDEAGMMEKKGKKEKGKKGREKRRRTGWRRLLPTWRMVLGGLLLIVLLISGALVAGYLLVSIPAPNEAAAAQTNVYLYADGSQIARDGDINRESVPLSKVPKETQHAVLAAEDRDFYHESAVDPQAMARAGWNMLTGGGRQSGSTITQQYVKNYYLSQDQTVTRKAKEFFIALKLDNEVSKNEILQGYLNTSYFGRNAYGIQSAAHAYYGKEVKELTTEESAYLAALVNSPNAYDTRAHPENKKRALARWNYVLDGMVEEGWLKKSDRKGMEFPEPDEPKPARNMSGERGYLVEAVKNYLINNKIIDEQRLRAGGFRITTTFQPKKQKAMRDAVDDKLMSKLDKKNRKIDKYVRAGGASVDPKTGEVVAMYGGIGATKQWTNAATNREYQVGSTFKPFVFTSAVQNKSTTQDGRPIKLNTVYDGTNKREVVSDGQGTDYAPANEDDRSYGQIPVTTAMDKSVNSVFAQMGIDVGPKKVKQTAIDLGLPKTTPNLTEDGSIALGVAAASPLDMAEAYATLANHGKHGHYSMVSKITRGGEVVDLPDHDSKRAVSRAAADTTTASLRSVVEGGTGTAAQAAGRPAAGKTGTAEEDKAAWFAGYTPDLSTVIGVMGKDPANGAQKPLYGAGGQPRVNGGGFPAEIWGAYTKEALEGRPAKKFDLDTAGSGDVPSTRSPGTSQPPSGPPTSQGPSDQPSQPQEPSDDPSTPEPPTTGPPTSPGPSIPETGGVDGGDPGGGPGGDGGNGDPGGGPGGDGAVGGNGDPGGGAPGVREW
ncbi:transglycosylase domain-containing protein [Streptomyces tubbatahanensis]